MSAFTDLFAKIFDKAKGLVPGAKTASDVDLTVELDKMPRAGASNGERPSSTS